MRQKLTKSAKMGNVYFKMYQITLMHYAWVSKQSSSSKELILAVGLKSKPRLVYSL